MHIIKLTHIYIYIFISRNTIVNSNGSSKIQSVRGKEKISIRVKMHNYSKLGRFFSNITCELQGPVPRG